MFASRTSSSLSTALLASTCVFVHQSRLQMLFCPPACLIEVVKRADLFGVARPFEVLRSFDEGVHQRVCLLQAQYRLIAPGQLGRTCEDVKRSKACTAPHTSASSPTIL